MLKVNANVGKTIANYRLHMAGITQNEQKCLIFIVIPRGRKNLIILEQKKKYSTSKKIKTVLY